MPHDSIQRGKDFWGDVNQTHKGQKSIIINLLNVIEKAISNIVSINIVINSLDKHYFEQIEGLNKKINLIELHPEQVSSMVLGRMKEVAEQYLGEKVVKRQDSRNLQQETSISPKRKPRILAAAKAFHLT